MSLDLTNGIEFMAGHYRAATLRAVGFNPFRQQDKTGVDVAIVVTFIIITAAVVLWALFGG